MGSGVGISWFLSHAEGMKQIIVLVAGLLFSLWAAAFPENYEKRLHRGPVVFAAANDYVYDTVRDTTGSIYVVGSTDGTFSGQSSSGGLDAYIAKYNSSGVLQWVRQFGTASTEAAYCVTADTTGANVYVAGFTDGAIGTQIGGRDGFVRKYTSAGVVSWTVQYGTAGTDVIYGCTRDATNNPIIVGSTTGAFSGFTNQGSTDAFIAELTSAAGAQSYVQQIGTAGEDELFAAGIDSSNRPYASGYTSGSMTGFTNAGGYDAWAVRRLANGNASWIRQVGTTGDDYAYTMTCLVSGVCYMGGMTTGTWSGQTALGNEDAWVAALTAAGAVSWTRQFGTSGNDAVKGGRMDTSNRPMLLGTTDDAFAGYVNKGYNDVFYTRYTTTGTVNQAPVQSGTTGMDSIFATGTGTLTALPCAGAANREYTGYTILKAYDIYTMSFSTTGVQSILSQDGTSN